MGRKIIIIILSLLILASLGTIGYLIYSQNNIGSVSQKIKQVTKTVTQTNPFPLSSVTPVSPIEVNNVNSGLSTTTNNTTKLVANNPNLDQLSIAGLSLLKIGNNLTTLFTERNTGNIYSLDNQNNLTRLTNTTLVGVGEAYLGQSKNNIYSIFRQIKDDEVSNLAGQFTFSTTSQATNLKTTSWSNTFYNFALSPDKQKILILTKTANNGTVALISNLDLKEPKQIWTSPLSDWQASWPTTTIIALTTKPSNNYAGSLFLVDIKNNKTSKILNNINGLTVKISPDGKKLIYNKSLLNNFNLYQYDLSSGLSTLIGLNTLTDKCVWQNADTLYCAVPKNIPSGRYPDDWYMGKLSLADDVWKIDVKQKTTTQIASLKGNYDLINLTPNEQTGWLYAINKDDNTLQAFSLKP